VATFFRSEPASISVSARPGRHSPLATRGNQCARC
jgi:hypothetical protein